MTIKWGEGNLMKKPSSDMSNQKLIEGIEGIYLDIIKTNKKANMIMSHELLASCLAKAIASSLVLDEQKAIHEMIDTRGEESLVAENTVLVILAQALAKADVITCKEGGDV